MLWYLELTDITSRRFWRSHLIRSACLSVSLGLIGLGWDFWNFVTLSSIFIGISQSKATHSERLQILFFCLMTASVVSCYFQILAFSCSNWPHGSQTQQNLYTRTTKNLFCTIPCRFSLSSVVESVALSSFQWWQEKFSVSNYQIKASAALSTIMINWLN